MNTKGLLSLSLAGNLILVVISGYLISKKEPEKDVSTSQDSPAKPAVTKKSTAAKAASSAQNVPTAHQISWRMVESADYREYIENLRSIGCPEETIRDIITADVNKLFEARRKEMSAASTNKFEFWKSGSMFSGMLDETKIKQKQELAKEKRELLKTLLGADVEEKVDVAAMMNPFQDMLDFLPEGKQTKVMELMESMQAKAMKSFKDGAPDAADMKEMQKVQKDMESEMAKILTPEEFENYQLRLSQTSMIMRMQLASFEPNEQEFRDIFKLQKKFDDDYGVMGMAFGEDKEKANKARKELNEEIKSTLGAERYVDYERAKDPAYPAIAKVAQREGLPKEASVKVYDMKKMAEAAASKVRADQSLSAEQRKSSLEAIRAETERSMGEVLGQKAMDSYKTQPSAYWLRGISPNPKTASAK